MFRFILSHLFGFRDPIREMDKLAGTNIMRSATLASAPTDYALWDEAEKRMGHVSPKAVSDEYDRLILRKYGQ